MTIEIDRDALVEALRAVGEAVEARNTIPILSNLLLRADGEQLSITGTNLDVQATAQIAAAGELSTTVDAAKFLAGAQSFKPGRLKIAPVEGRAAVTLKQGRGVRTLPTLPADDFPQWTDDGGATTFEMEAAGLARLLDATYVAQSTEETRYYLKGVFLHSREGMLTAFATDGFRGIRADCALPDGAAGLPDTIIPTKLITMLRKLLTKPSGTVALAIGASKMEVRIGSFLLRGKVVDGTYPDYQRSIPQPGKHVLTIMRDGLIEPVNAVAAMSAEKVRAIAIDLDRSGCEVHANDQTGSSGSEGIDVAYEGQSIRFGVNHRYLTSVAGVFAESGELTLSIESAASAMRLTGSKDPDLVAVIMPMRA